MGMAEQGLLNALYADSFKEWPFEYNGNLAAAAQAPTFWAAAKASLRIIHYTWIKPFDPDAPRHHDYAACKEDLDTWLKARTDMVAGLGLNLTSSLPRVPAGASVPVR
jgi:lipopolysaccharide biosynthesis glycosyltransferase